MFASSRPDDRAAALEREVVAPAIDGGGSRAAGERHAERLGGGRHGVRREHAGTRALGRAGAALDLTELVLGERAGRTRTHGLEHADDVEDLVLVVTREDRTAVEEHGREVEPGRGHQHPGQALVAAGERDERVEALGVHDALDRVGDDLPRHEGTPHALVTHRDAVADGDRDELDREAAGVADAELRPLRETVERHVARRDLVPARRDRRPGLLPQSASVIPTARSIARAPAFSMPSVTSRLRGFTSCVSGLMSSSVSAGPTLTDVALVLVATSDGVVPILDGVPAAVELGGRRVDGLARRRDEWWAVADRHTVVHRDGDGTWTELATAEQRLTCVLPAPGGAWCGTRDGRLLRLLDGRFAPSDAFDAVDGSRARGTPSGASSRTCDRSRRPPTIAHCSPTSTSVGSRVPGTVARAGSPPSIRTPTCTRCVPTRAIRGSCSPRPRSVSRSVATAAPPGT